MPDINPKSFNSRIAQFLVRYRIAFSFLILSGLLIEDLVRGIHPRSIHSFKDPLGLIGLLFVVGGISLRSWAAGIIHKSHALATTGPYSLTRHPLYLGSFFLALGFAIILQCNANIWAVLIMTIVFYVPKIRQEEALLKDKFGEEWAVYSRHTGLLFPKARLNLKSNWLVDRWQRHCEYRALLTCLILLATCEAFHEFDALPQLKRDAPQITSVVYPSLNDQVAVGR